ncbi:Tellurium resistance [Streptomyces sp. JJ66]|uniref:TerD family protein n=1 Tax=Streptomyces sp. JJ66 TaxID=2803843 RepID=UPI001C57C7C1|nr:Tellurium resistance [Streptomyces sp. JJ66]MBW1601406.1 Tellurium resistance [Streptomyces sp. JJ66]
MTDGGSSPSKVTLTKESPRVSLDKSEAAHGTLTVNLNWNARPEGDAAGGGGKRGFLAKLQSAFQPQGGIDLDLGCLWEFSDGSKGVVQALGNAFTARDKAGRTVLSLDGDDRSGAAVAGENLRIELEHADSIKRVLVFALIYEGVPNWEQADAVVTLTRPGQAPIEVRLDESDQQSRICAIAMIENTGRGLTVQREVRHVRGAQKALDQAYQWGMDWAPGRK